MGLCCFYAGQYDLTLSCFERALMLADDDNMADVWYNIGQVAIGVGDLGAVLATSDRARCLGKFRPSMISEPCTFKPLFEAWLTKPSRSPFPWTPTTPKVTTTSGCWSCARRVSSTSRWPPKERRLKLVFCGSEPTLCQGNVEQAQAGTGA